MLISVQRGGGIATGSEARHEESPKPITICVCAGAVQRADGRPLPVRDLTNLIETWDGAGVVMHYDESTSSWFFIALHDTTRGMAVGGCRMKEYPSPADGLRDAMRLAEGMTYKWAGVEIGFGGGKSVIALSRPFKNDGERHGLLRRFGKLVATLRGAYACGVDLGTTPSDIATIAQETDFVMGFDRASGESADPGPYTALGVLEGIRASLAHVFGSDELAGRSIVIQGVGDVGEPLARMLHAGGATVVVSDIDSTRAQALAESLEAKTIPADEVYDTSCNVFAPCAIGGTVNAETIPRLQCRIVAGSANNQLEEWQDAERVHQRGILYAPDYIINAGGAVAFGMMHLGESDDDIIRTRVRQIGPALTEIFREGAEQQASPLNAARARAERVLQA